MSEPAPPAFTGERFLPDCSGAIALEHWHRYAVARPLARGRRVLDAACGEGYGTAHLATEAALAVGIDIGHATVTAASRHYASSGARYIAAAVEALPFADASFDLVVSFETIEHVGEDQQRRMLAEFARVLDPRGLLLISSPNKAVYSDRSGYRNEFHVHELYRDEMDALLGRHFPHRRWYGQKLHVGSGFWPEGPVTSRAEALALQDHKPATVSAGEPMYYVVLAAGDPAILSDALPAASVMVDTDEVVMGGFARAESEAMRLDRLLGERDATIAGMVPELERRAALVGLRDQELQNRDANIARLERAVAAQRAELVALQQLAEAHASGIERLAKIAHEHDEVLERTRREHAARLQARDDIIHHRQSWRWWLKLPVARAKWFVDALIARAGNGR